MVHVLVTPFCPARNSWGLTFSVVGSKAVRFRRSLEGRQLEVHGRALCDAGRRWAGVGLNAAGYLEAPWDLP